jgi:hypothetical protein
MCFWEEFVKHFPARGRALTLHCKSGAYTFSAKSTNSFLGKMIIVYQKKSSIIYSGTASIITTRMVIVSFRRKLWKIKNQLQHAMAVCAIPPATDFSGC